MLLIKVYILIRSVFAFELILTSKHLIFNSSAHHESSFKFNRRRLQHFLILIENFCEVISLPNTQLGQDHTM